jgi:hypothetical protein
MAFASADHVDNEVNRAQKSSRTGVAVIHLSRSVDPHLHCFRFPPRGVKQSASKGKSRCATAKLKAHPAQELHKQSRMAVVGAEKGKKARISPASARSHTQNSPSESRSSFISTAGILVWSVLLLLLAVAASLVFKTITPPPPKLLNSSSPDGLTVTAPRVRMRDGRFLAYKERGVPRETAQYHVISVHGYGRSRHDIFRASEELLNDLGIYLVAFDRAGYGQSDPHPERTIKSAVNDIEDFANELGLKPKFYVIATSIGSYTAWGLIKYLPDLITATILNVLLELGGRTRGLL